MPEIAGPRTGLRLAVGPHSAVRVSLPRSYCRVAGSPVSHPGCPAAAMAGPGYVRGRSAAPRVLGADSPTALGEPPQLLAWTGVGKGRNSYRLPLALLARW